MEEDQGETKLKAIAAKALLLEPGDSFVVRVEGGESRAEECVDAVLEELERQFAAARAMHISVAVPSAIGYSIVETAADRAFIVLEHLTDTEDDGCV